MLAEAQAHPSDPEIPEALYLTLRTIRYGCYHGLGYNSDLAAEKDRNDRIATIAQQVAVIMRKRYPSSPWTKKAAPFVWPVKKDG